LLSHLIISSGINPWARLYLKQGATKGRGRGASASAEGE